MNIVNIETDRLIIRNLRQTDLNDFYVYRSNLEVTKYQGFDVMTMEQASDFITNNSFRTFGNAGEWVQYGIESKPAGKMIGDCAMKPDQYDVRIVEIGIAISHLAQRKGYGREALLGLLTFLFGSKQIHRVVAIVDVENMASINLFKSAGFRQEGHFVENIFFKGHWGSEFQYAMLNKEWETTYNNPVDKKIINQIQITK